MNLNTEEILALLDQPDSDDEMDDVEEIFIELPAGGDETDEDKSGGKIDNLSGRQLQACAEAVLRSGKRVGCPNNEDHHPENDKTGYHQSLPKKNKVRKTIHWEKKVLFLRLRIYS